MKFNCIPLCAVLLASLIGSSALVAADEQKPLPQNPNPAVDDTLYKSLKPQAEAGDAESQIALAYVFENGKGVTQSYAEAAKWYRKAAESGNDKGQFFLGNCYLEGRGVEKDPMQAVLWYEKSAAQKNPEAMFNLGNIYVFGVAGGTDEQRGVGYWERAADLKHIQATMNLAVYYFQGGSARAPDYTKAQKWLKRGAEYKHPMVDFMFGLSYWKGLGVERNYMRAKRYFQKAIGASHPVAQRKLDEMEREIKPRQRVVIVENAVLNDTPKPDAQVLSTLPRGNTVISLEERDGWQRVNTDVRDSPFGWLPNNALSPSE